MALNIKNVEVEKLAAEVAEMTGATKTGAVHQALLEKRERLRLARGRSGPTRSLQDFLETEIWPQIPAEERGRPPMTKAEREEILGDGPGGV